MDGIDTYKKLINAKKYLHDTWNQIQLMSIVLAQQKDVIIALIKLQSFGVTVDGILNVYRFLERAREQQLGVANSERLR